MEVDIEELRALFQRRIIGRRVEYEEEMDSTNTEATRLALEGAPEGTVVLTDCQRKGRGRMRRTWESPPGVNLYLSVILRPDIPATGASLVPLMIGTAAAETIGVYCPGRVRLKWPNDVLVGGKKICGILTEMRTAGERVAFLVAGLGINVNGRQHAFSPELRDTATSLRIETGMDVDRLDVAVRLFEAVERCYRIFLNGGGDSIRQTWLRHADILGRRVEIVHAGTVQRGTVAGLDASGALLLDGESGVQRVLAGDVTIERL